MHISPTLALLVKGQFKMASKLESISPVVSLRTSAITRASATIRCPIEEAANE